MNEEEIIKDIRETNYNEQNVEELLYELKNDTGTYSCYDNAMAIIYYKNLYKQEKEKNKELEGIKADYIRRMKASNEVLRKQGYISKDKIKEKIEELEKEKNIPHEIDFKAFYRIEDLKNIQLSTLKELLEG